MSKSAIFRVGLVINPIAGIGGPLALHGSDQLDIHSLHNREINERVVQFLQALQPWAGQVEFYCWGGAMGESALKKVSTTYHVVGSSPDSSNASDTRKACVALVAHGIDLLVFAGGDGTARDVVDSGINTQPVLGLPTGVKMHSGVFALGPVAAAEIIIGLLEGSLVGVQAGEVRDIDEEMLYLGKLNSRYYGELQVPVSNTFLQHTKSGGREDEALAVQDIVAFLSESILENPGIYLVGAGSTLFELKQSLGMTATLLGVDVVESLAKAGNGVRCVQLATNADSEKLEHLVTGSGGRQAGILLSFARNQGFLYGRGNQQFSPSVIRAIGADQVRVVSTRTKLLSLEGRALIVDTGDSDLDASLCGMIPVVAGYEDHVFYRVMRSYQENSV